MKGCIGFFTAGSVGFGGFRTAGLKKNEIRKSLHPDKKCGLESVPPDMVFQVFLLLLLPKIKINKNSKINQNA